VRVTKGRNSSGAVVAVPQWWKERGLAPERAAGPKDTPAAEAARVTYSTSDDFPFRLPRFPFQRAAEAAAAASSAAALAASAAAPRARLGPGGGGASGSGRGTSAPPAHGRAFGTFASAAALATATASGGASVPTAAALLGGGRVSALCGRAAARPLGLRALLQASSPGPAARCLAATVASACGRGRSCACGAAPCACGAPAV